MHSLKYCQRLCFSENRIPFICDIQEPWLCFKCWECMKCLMIATWRTITSKCIHLDTPHIIAPTFDFWEMMFPQLSYVITHNSGVLLICWSLIFTQMFIDFLSPLWIWYALSIENVFSENLTHRCGFTFLGLNEPCNIVATDALPFSWVITSPLTQS